jgi:hypothetical protein
MGRREKTHEDEHPIGVPFPTLCRLTVLFPGPTEIHGEKSFRTIGKVGLSRRSLILVGRFLSGWVVVVICRRK